MDMKVEREVEQNVTPQDKKETTYRKINHNLPHYYTDPVLIRK